MNVAKISSELQALQKQRVWYLKSRIMVANRLQATVAGTLGYESGMTEAQRAKKMKEATKLIKVIDAKHKAGEAQGGIASIVINTLPSIKGFNAEVIELDKLMEKMTKQLPMVDWVHQPAQRGVGLKSLGVIIGETGDLHNYSTVSKVWRRMGLAPITKNGETHMGSTWRGRKNGQTKLNAREWQDGKYNPRRRAIMFVVGENLVRQNGLGGNGDKSSDTEPGIADPDLSSGGGELETETDANRATLTHPTGAGPYRMKYDEAKARSAEVHPEWLICSKCEGTGKTAKGTNCENCKGNGEVWMHCHLHAMLLSTKLLLKNLWIVWNGEVSFDSETCGAVLCEV